MGRSYSCPWLLHLQLKLQQMKKIFLMIMLLPFIGAAQEKGVKFEHGFSWQQLKQKAKEQNKYLFVDCYTTWCAPCRQMASEVFTQEKVGDFFNTNFVSVKIQFDQTKNDSEEIKSWYSQAKAINDELKITAYPTFLIFSPQGNLVHRVVGGGNADDFISWIKVALNPATQYYTLLKSDSTTVDPQLLKKLALGAQIAKDEKNTTKFVEAYMKTQDNLLSKDNIEFVSRFVSKSDCKAFRLMENNREVVDSVLGKGRSNEILGAIIMQENINPAIGNRSLNIDSLIDATKAKYPTVDIGLSAGMAKLLFFQVNKRWDKFQPEVITYMGKYRNELIPNALCYFAKTVLENCEGADYMAAATAWAKLSVEKTQGKVPGYLDIYAQLLYRTGKREEAIAIEKKAINLTPDGTNAPFKATLDKMLNN